jgi:large subunit ribosomal protein L44e
MKLPKTRRTYCPHCKKHTEHKILESKKKTAYTAHPMSYGGKWRAKRRGALGRGNRGKYSKPPITKWKLAGKKQSKKTDLRFECAVCKKMHNQRKGFRTKRIEFK